MPKRIAIASAVTFIGILLIASFYHYLHRPQFSCESQFSFVQKINQDTIHSEGLMFVDMSDEDLLITMDGLLSHNNEKYIISRTLEIKYETYNSSAHLYKLTGIKTIRDDTDNVEDKIANDLLFDGLADNKIIYIKKLNSDVILFGNYAFPQYGCRRK